MSEHTPATFLGELLGNLRQWTSALWRLEGKFKGVTFEGKAQIIGRPIMSVANGARLIIGTSGGSTAGRDTRMRDEAA